MMSPIGRPASRWILLLGLVWPVFTGATVASAQTASSTVVLIGLDGFHPSYLERPQSRHLRELSRSGAQARSLIPVFPTLTFPNFYTMATGLYPEHHGIVSNTMVDSTLGRFTLRDRAAVRDPRWWGGEPIWVTAVRQGKRVATFFWPGSDVAIGGVLPTWYKMFDAAVPNADRVTQVLDWLSLPADQAPSLITVYFGDVDDAGHQFGPDAPQTDAAIARVDSAVGAIMNGLKQRKLEERVNLVVVSDHGMARVEPGHLIYLDDIVDPATVNIVDLGPMLSLSPKPGAADTVYRALARVPHLQVYRKQHMGEVSLWRPSSNPRNRRGGRGGLAGDHTRTRRDAEPPHSRGPRLSTGDTLYAGDLPGTWASVQEGSGGPAVSEHPSLCPARASPRRHAGAKRWVAGLGEIGPRELACIFIEPPWSTAGPAATRHVPG